MHQQQQKYRESEFSFSLNPAKHHKNAKFDIVLWNNRKLYSGRLVISRNAVASWLVYQSYNAADEIIVKSSRRNFHRNFRSELRIDAECRMVKVQPNSQNHWAVADRWLCRRKSVCVTGKEDWTYTTYDQWCVEYRTYDEETETEIEVGSESWTKRWTAAQTRNGFTESTGAKLHFMHVWIRVNRMLVQRTLTVQFIKDWRWNRFVNHVITAFRFWRTRFRDRTNPPSRSVNSILFRYLAASLFFLSSLSFFRTLEKSLADSMELPWLEIVASHSRKMKKTAQKFRRTAKAVKNVKAVDGSSWRWSKMRKSKSFNSSFPFPLTTNTTSKLQKYGNHRSNTVNWSTSCWNPRN